MSYPQWFLNGFMEAEVYHSLGAYLCAINKIDDLESELAKKVPDFSPHINSVLSKRYFRIPYNNYNDQLAQKIHCADDKFRHPKPPEPKRLNHCVKSWADLPNKEHCKLVFEFYEYCIEILEKEFNEGDDSDKRIRNLRKCIIYKSDFVPSEKQKNEYFHKSSNYKEQLRVLKIDRFKKRLEEANKIIGRKVSIPNKKWDYISKSFLNDMLPGRVVNPLHEFIFRTMHDIHYRLHWVEHLESADFRNQIKNSENPEINKEKILSYCNCACTFLYTITRTAPWIFAENKPEKELVFRLSHNGRIHLAPPRCIWVAYQISLISLYRRAHCQALLGNNTEAFNDYHKVQLWARKIRSIFIDNNPTPLKGARDFVSAIDALSEYKIGELYRSDHAHTQAYEHFMKAYERLEELKKIPEMEEVLNESRWRIDLILSMGKALYELGYIKRSLKWYVRAWHNFIKITAIDSGYEINDIKTIELENWLMATKNEPDINKEELIKQLNPFIHSLKITKVSLRLRGLASDILNRISHNLYMIKLGAPPTPGKPVSINPIDDQVGDGLHSLSFECVRLAFHYDPHSTLIKSKFLQIMKNVIIEGYTPDTINNLTQNEALPQTKDDKNGEEKHWPMGGSAFERFSRIYEHYLLKEAIKKRNEYASENNNDFRIGMSVSMLVDFLTNTDSGSVKLSQIYKYLMKAPNEGPFEKGSSKTRMEFICLQRYSSFFPFLPRPSSFRIVGGGYLIRIYSKEFKFPFGIVIDPGSDFIENLYRAGFSIADIDMIIATHAHSDHTATIDPILSLLGYRISLGDKKFNDKANEKRLVILGNKSVVNRYKFFNKIPYEKASVRVEKLRSKLTKININSLMGKNDSLKSLDLNIESFDANHEDSEGNHSRGLRISIKGDTEFSIGITGDTSIDNFDKEKRKFKRILNSDVVIAHLSGVPLTQLRAIANVWSKKTQNPNGSPDYGWLKKIWDEKIYNKKASKAIKSLKKLITFSIWLKGKNGKPLQPFGEIVESDTGGSQHLYLSGITKFAEKFKKYRRKNESVFVLSELREDLASFRTKIAKGLNDHLFTEDNFKAITADIGLRIIIETEEDESEKKVKKIRVLCSSCEKDNDMTTREKYHSSKNIREVCVKGEDEGIFYNCILHDPSSQAKPCFIEKMERYDVFKRPFSLF